MPEELEQRLQREARAKFPGDERRQRAYVYGTLRKTGWTPERHAPETAPKKSSSKNPEPTRGRYQRDSAPHRGQREARPLVAPEPLSFTEREQRQQMLDASREYREQVEAELRRQAREKKQAQLADPTRVIKRRPRKRQE